jgi:hypothetical protein
LTPFFSAFFLAFTPKGKESKLDDLESAFRRHAQERSPERQEKTK